MRFRDAAFMGIMRWAFYNKLKCLYPDVSLTYGYITKSTRISNKLEKTHATDALCIAGNPLAQRLPNFFVQKAVRRNNRCLHKSTILRGGARKANKSPYEVHGFRLFDEVRYLKTDCFAFGRRATGSFDIRKLSGEVVNRGISYKKLTVLSKASTLLTERSPQGLRGC